MALHDDIEASVARRAALARKVDRSPSETRELRRLGYLLRDALPADRRRALSQDGRRTEPAPPIPACPCLPPAAVSAHALEEAAVEVSLARLRLTAMRGCHGLEELHAEAEALHERLMDLGTDAAAAEHVLARVASLVTAVRLRRL